jgi:hypothetical protein
MMENEDTGEIVTDAQIQELMRDVINKKGRLILSAPYPPQIGEVQVFAGLPMRCVRHVTLQEAVENGTGHPLERSWPDPEQFHFEAEVAD